MNWMVIGYTNEFNNGVIWITDLMAKIGNGQFQLVVQQNTAHIRALTIVIEYPSTNNVVKYIFVFTAPEWNFS